MSKDTAIGKNRTGLHVSPVHAAELEVPSHTVVPDASASSAAAMRGEYFQQAGPMGSVAPPGTIKGKFKAGMEAVSGHSMTALLDKLGERLAFERGGTRLYDAILAKLDAATADQLGPVDVGVVKRFRNEEAAHAALIQDVIEGLGGDPTSLTPGANLVGVQNLGLLQSVGDPRTTIPQCLQSLLAAELVDADAWELLVLLADGLGHDGLRDRFEAASAQEEIHLAQVREWVSQFAHEAAGVTEPVSPA